MVLLTRGRSQDRPLGLKKTREITAGCSVVVLNGRHFLAFGAGDEGVVKRVDHEAQNCDVLFNGKSDAVPVALRHLRAKSPVSREGATGRDVQGDWEDVADAIVEHRLPRTAEDVVFDAVDTDHDNVISRAEFKDAIKAGIIAEDGSVHAYASADGVAGEEEVSMVCAAEISGASEGWPGTDGIQVPASAVTATVHAGALEELGGSPASLDGRGTSQATDLQTLPDGQMAGFAAGVAVNAAAAAAAAEAAAAVNSSGFLHRADPRVGQAIVQAHKLPVPQAKVFDIQSGYIACGPPSTGPAGDLAVSFGSAPHLLSVNNGLHLDPNMRICDTSSISAHSDAPPSMGYVLTAPASYHVAAPTPGWGVEATCAPPMPCTVRPVIAMPRRWP